MVFLFLAHKAAASMFLIKRPSSLLRNLWNWGGGGCWSVLPHFNFLRETMKHCDWMAVIYATQAATVQSWIGLSSHSVEACWLWGLFIFFEEDRLLAFCHSGLQVHMDTHISKLLWQQNSLLQSHKWRICAISIYPWKDVTKLLHLLRRYRCMKSR